MAEASEREPFKGWAVLELMGHRRLGGFVSEEQLFGVVLCRIDVPATPPFTQYYGGSAVYCLTPTTEAIARALTEQNAPLPVHPFELPARVGGSIQPSFDDDMDAPDVDAPPTF